ncbi:MAG: hypothetical protein HOP11_10050 [Saprospiraceae bacterium]|nr:hypothetical protein [Saprospiraceae bacterium]
MKLLLNIVLVFLLNAFYIIDLSGQTKMVENGKISTTTKAPKGTYFKNGFLKTEKGYEFEFSKENVSMASLKSNGVIVGTIECNCSVADGTCALSKQGTGLMCVEYECEGSCSAIVIMKNSGVAKILLFPK